MVLVSGLTADKTISNRWQLLDEAEVAGLIDGEQAGSVPEGNDGCFYVLQMLCCIP